MALGEIVKKHRIALLLDITNNTETPSFKRIKKSTELTINMNPETVTYDYIADESPTTELDRYSPSINQPLTMYKGEDDFGMIFDRFFFMDTGLDAHARMMIVYMFEGSEEDGFLAWETDVVLTLDNMDGVASTITPNVLFGGTTRKGLAKITEGKWTFEEKDKAELKTFIEEHSLSTTSASTPASGGSTHTSETDPDDPLYP